MGRTACDVNVLIRCHVGNWSWFLGLTPKVSVDYIRTSTRGILDSASQNVVIVVTDRARRSAEFATVSELLYLLYNMRASAVMIAVTLAVTNINSYNYTRRVSCGVSLRYL